MLFTSIDDTSGFIREVKDSWSTLQSKYEAPATGYSRTLHLNLKRTKNKVFEKNEVSNFDYIVFKVRRNSEGGDKAKAWYGKLYGPLIYGIMTNDREGAGVKFTYYLNPTPNDCNLEADGQYP